MNGYKILSFSHSFRGKMLDHQFPHRCFQKVGATYRLCCCLGICCLIVIGLTSGKAQKAPAGRANLHFFFFNHAFLEPQIDPSQEKSHLTLALDVTTISLQALELSGAAGGPSADGTSKACGTDRFLGCFTTCPGNGSFRPKTLSELFFESWLQNLQRIGVNSSRCRLRNRKKPSSNLT